MAPPVLQEGRDPPLQDQDAQPQLGRFTDSKQQWGMGGLGGWRWGRGCGTPCGGEEAPPQRDLAGQVSIKATHGRLPHPPPPRQQAPTPDPEQRPVGHSHRRKG